MVAIPPKGELHVSPAASAFRRNRAGFLGSVGSTRSIHARMPPVRLRAFVIPWSRSRATAFALRPPILQWTTMSGRPRPAGSRRAASAARRAGSASTPECGRSRTRAARARRESTDARRDRARDFKRLDRRSPGPPRWMRPPRVAAGMPQNCSIVDERRDRRMIAAHRARRIAPQLHRPELMRQRVAAAAAGRRAWSPMPRISLIASVA